MTRRLRERVFVVECQSPRPSYQCLSYQHWMLHHRPTCNWCKSRRVRPQWRIDISIQAADLAQHCVPALSRLSLRGALLDPVMAMTVGEFLFLEAKFGSLSDHVARFWTHSSFDVVRCDLKPISLSLPPGCQLTFLNWLGMQPSFDIDTLVATLSENCPEGIGGESPICLPPVTKCLAGIVT
jgi:hypothetical protein